VEEYSPDLIIEVGTWIGASAINIAHLMRNHGIEWEVICIDNRLGSIAHRSNVEKREAL